MMDCGEEMSNKVTNLQQQNSCKLIPNNWKTIGAVYLDSCEQCVFVCLFCLKNVENTDDFAFTTNDGSALWSHIKENHILNEPVGKKRRLEANETESLQNEKNFSRNAESASPPPVESVRNFFNSSSVYEY